MVHGAQDNRRAGRRRPEDGHRPKAPRAGLHTPFRPRRPVRQPPSRQDDEGCRHQAVDGVRVVALGQRRHRIAHGRHQIRVRARPHLRQPRAGGALPVRVHRGLLQQDPHPFGVGLAQPRRVRRKACKRKPSGGGIEPVNENGADSFALTVEAGVFSRFDSARAFASWLGLVPSEHSSGERTSRGGITKAGNSHLRKLLVEASWHYTRSTKERKRSLYDEGVPASISNHAAVGVKRLVERRRHLSCELRKRPAVANVATARELACWIWALGRMSEGTLA